MDSILTTIKSMLGPEEDYEHFDTDIIIFINTALMKLNQLGVGPVSGFRITDKSQTWDEFIGNELDLEGVKSFVYMDVRLVFDPPQLAYVAEALKEQIKELGWRIVVQIENNKIDQEGGNNNDG